jgi:hypothetical protein
METDNIEHMQSGEYPITEQQRAMGCQRISNGARTMQGSSMVVDSRLSLRYFTTVPVSLRAAGNSRATEDLK